MTLDLPGRLFDLDVPECRTSEIDCRIRCLAKVAYHPSSKVDHPLSGAISNLFMLWFREICKDKPPSSEGYKGTTEKVVILKQTNSHNYPDAALTKTAKPLIAVEIGVTQSPESLFAGCHQYLRDDSAGCRHCQYPRRGPLQTVGSTMEDEPCRAGDALE